MDQCRALNEEGGAESNSTSPEDRFASVLRADPELDRMLEKLLADRSRALSSVFNTVKQAKKDEAAWESGTLADVPSIRPLLELARANAEPFWKPRLRVLNELRLAQEEEAGVSAPDTTWNSEPGTDGNQLAPDEEEGATRGAGKDAGQQGRLAQIEKAWAHYCAKVPAANAISKLETATYLLEKTLKDAERHPPTHVTDRGSIACPLPYGVLHAFFEAGDAFRRAVVDPFKEIVQSSTKRSKKIGDANSERGMSIGQKKKLISLMETFIKKYPGMRKRSKTGYVTICSKVAEAVKEEDEDNSTKLWTGVNDETVAYIWRHRDKLK